MKTERGIWLQEYFKTGRITVYIDGSTNRKTLINKDGYKIMCAQYNNRCREFPLHQIVWVWFKGPVPEGLEIDHIDNNKLNNAISNLQLLTPHQNNMKEAARHAVISQEQVLKMRDLHKDGTKIKDIHSKYPMISINHLKKILYREKWKHI